MNKRDIELMFEYLKYSYNRYSQAMEKVKNLLKMADFFNSFQMLRFQKETEYRTFTGGLISIGIIITIIVAFASMIINTVNRTIISFTHNEQKGSVPSLTQIMASPDDNFMFAVEVQGYNLSSEHRYFDVVFDQIQSSYGSNYVHTPYSLEPCTKAHWAMLPSVVDSFEKIKASNWLCPTLGTVITLQGKFSSETYNQFSVTLYPCSNSTDPSRPCAPIEEIEAYVASNGQWNYFNFYYVNSIINADQPQYKSYYLEDRNYIPFSSTLGAELDMYLTEIKITSDNSIWPFEDNSEDSVFYIPFGPILYPIAVDNTTCYATFYVMKDYANEFYIRQVQKIFVVFSFMGGLIGAIMASLFVINTYTSFAYQIALAIDVFKDSDETNTHKYLKEKSKGSVNIIHFFQYYVYWIAKKFKQNISWPFIDYIEECREQILYQLDIKGLIKRIIFLQYAISYILQDYHLSEMQKQKPIIPSEVKKLREKIDAKEDKSKKSESQLNSALSGKPMQAGLEPESIIENNGISTKEDIRAFKNHVEIKPDIIQMGESKVSDIQIQDFSVIFAKGQKIQSIKKMKDSAKEGNFMSKKLIVSVKRKPTLGSLSSSSLERQKIFCDLSKQ